MAKKQQKQQLLSPERYIRERARKLPIYKCYKGETIGDKREMAILVIRQHAGGTFTLAGFMLDRWCVGVKDALWLFNCSEEEMEQMVDTFADRLEKWTEVDYVEAHNWVYGALDWATNAGINPCKDFAVARYILEEDDDRVELREYEFGNEGEYCLMAKNQQEANRYIPALNKTLGVGNYQVIIHAVEEDDMEDDEESPNHSSRPRMSYTYRGGDYPKTIRLYHPEAEIILRKDTLTMTQADIDTLLSLPKETLREDMHQLVLQELGRQYGKTDEQLQDDNTPIDWCIMGNCFLFLAEIGSQESLSVLLEFLRQNEDVLRFNEGDSGEYLVKPLLYRCLRDNPALIQPFLLEEGLAANAKMEVLDYLANFANCDKAMRAPILKMMREVLPAYKQDLPKHTICDGEVVAFAIEVLIASYAKECLPMIEELYATGLVDNSVNGNMSEVRKLLLMSDTECSYSLPSLKVRDIIKAYQACFKD